ncbi:MAG TPA: hypothetical protein VFV59_01115 [Candidatus Limnocylindria bacterium]|nr:hypothetical protein [Candidatus Limnocylindria bacterium]
MLASETANYISLDFVASAPHTYDHSTGGGAFDDRTVGVDDDIVESLEGGDFACGDTVTFLTEISLDGSQDDPNVARTIQLEYSFLLDTTGQTGLALGPITYVGINYGNVGGDGAGGTDAGMNDDLGSTATLISQSAPAVVKPPYFTAGATNDVVIDVTDLEDSETVILRIDAEINCLFNSSPTGNLQADLQSATVIAIGGQEAADTVPGGAQTVPFKAAGDVVFPGKIIVDKVTDPAGATQSFNFTVTAPGSANADPYSDAFSLTDASTPHNSGEIDPSTAQIGNQTVTIAGNYTVSEINIPSAWQLDTLVCTSDDNGQVYSGTAASTTFSLHENEIVTCVFTNELQQGTLKVVKYHDLNADGDRDAGEGPLSGWEFFIDNNADGVWNAGDSAKQSTNASGEATFTLNAGTYSVCEVLQATWFNSDPGTATPCESATVVAGQETTKSFGNYQNGTKSGFKYEDEAADGDYDAGADALLEGWNIYAIRDDNGDGQLDAAELSDWTLDETDAVTGAYSFSLSPGKYFICEETGGSAWSQSSPASGQTGFTGECDDQNATANPDLAPGGYYITVTSQSTDTGNEFGNFRQGTKSGTKYHDLNADGDRNAGDVALGGWVIRAYVDDNGDGILQATETTIADSATTDATTGAYELQLDPGDYVVCEVSQAGWTQSAPANTLCDLGAGLEPGGWAITVTSNSTDVGNDFGNFQEVDQTVLKYHDLNADGDRDAGEPVLSGWTFFIDENANEVLDAGEVSALTNASGIATFEDLMPGASYDICEVLTSGWLNSDPSGATLCESTDTIVSGSTPTQLVFGNFQEVDQTVLKYRDLNNSAVRDPGEPVLSGWTFFIDVDGDEILDAGEVSVITGASGTATFNDLMPGASYSICEVLTAGWLNSEPVGSTLCRATGTLVSGVTPGTLEFGNRLPSLVIDKVASTETITISGPNDALVATPSVVTWTLTYTLTEGPVTNAVITDPVPAGFTFLDASNGGTFANGVVTWNLGTLMSSGSVTFRTTVDPTTISRIAPTVNTATIDSNETPPDQGQDSVTVSVVPPPLAGNPTPKPSLPNTAAGIGMDGQPVTVPVELLVAFFLGSLGVLTLANVRARSRRQ